MNQGIPVDRRTSRNNVTGTTVLKFILAAEKKDERKKKMCTVFCCGVLIDLTVL